MSFAVAEPLFVPLDGYVSTTVSGQVPHYPLGARYTNRSTGKTYAWVKAAASLINSAFAANEVLSRSSATLLEFTNDVSAGIGGTTAPIMACRANSACPTSTSSLFYYCWVQIGGDATIKTNGDNDMVVGDGFIVSSTDGAANGVALAATSADGVILRTFAIALASEASSACSVVLRCTDWAL